MSQSRRKINLTVPLLGLLRLSPVLGKHHSTIRKNND